MIAHLEGTVFFRGTNFVILQVGDIGYKLFCPIGTLKKIPEKGSKFKLYTHLYKRDDTIELYGFLNFAELEFFEMLISITGIGPKSAISILSVATLDSLKRAIGSGETAHLTKVSGIGRKTAEKIVLELRDKLGDAEVSSKHFTVESDTLDALISLGYTKQEAREAISKISPDITDVEKKVAEALKILGKSS